MHKFKFLLFVLVFISFSAQAAEEPVSFRLLNNDFELMLEVGPAFLQSPVFKSQGVLQPFVKVNYKQPRYVGATLGWWFNDYLLFQLGVNFTSADFEGGEDIGGQGSFNRAFSNNFLYQTEVGLSEAQLGFNDQLPSVGCVGVLSIYCASRAPLITHFENAAIRSEQAYLDIISFTPSFTCNDACALGRARTAIETDVPRNRDIINNRAESQFLLTGGRGRLDVIIRDEINVRGVANCGVDCQEAEALAILRAERQAVAFANAPTYDAYLESLSNYATIKGEVETEITDSKERCFGACLDTRIRSRFGQSFVALSTGTPTEIRTAPEYRNRETADLASEYATCQNIPGSQKTNCEIAIARQLISNRASREQARIAGAYNTWLEGRPEYNSDTCEPLDDSARRTCVANELSGRYTTAYNNSLNGSTEQEVFNVWLRTQTEYRTALNGECDDACALTAAENSIRTDEAASRVLANAADREGGDINRFVRAILADSALATTTPSSTVSAGGTFLSVGSFANVYGNYPVTRNFSLYGGGGIGLVWTKVDEGLITRTASINLSTTSAELDAIISRADVPTGARISVRDILLGLSRTQTTRRDISDSTLSYAFSGGLGVRTEVFEGLTLDTGYQMQWNPKLYKQADAQWIHQMRVGFVFKF